jgi:hypothetical protein
MGKFTQWHHRIAKECFSLMAFIVFTCDRM